MKIPRNKGYSILSEEGLILIKKNTDYILEKIGIDLYDDPISIETLKTIGATSDGQRVWVCGKKLREYIKANIPAQFTWRGASSDNDIIVGGAEQIFAPVYGPPKIHRTEDTHQGNPNHFSQHLGTIADYRKLVSLCDQSKSLQSTGFMLCYVHDIHETQLHIAMANAHLELSKKPFMGTVMSENSLLEVIQLVGRRNQPNECNLLHLINSTPPLSYQKNPLKCLRAASLAGEGLVITSYSMMGATSPVTIAGVLAQGYAEVLLGVALSQLYRPGTPVIFSIYAAPFSMSSMLPVYGQSNSSLVQLISCQLARDLGMPSRGEGFLTSSKLDDAQAGYEGGSTMTASISSNADFILHSGGWLFNGQYTSPRKLVRESQLLESLAGY